MDYSKLATFDFLFSLGYVTLGASAATIVLTEVAKLVFRRAAALRPGVDPTRRDIFLSGVGRVMALISYASLYVVDTLLIRKVTLALDSALVASLLGGSALTLVVSKGIYTAIRQMAKRKGVFDKLEAAEEAIARLESEVKCSGLLPEDPIDIDGGTPTCKKWVIKGE